MVITKSDNGAGPLVLMLPKDRRGWRGRKEHQYLNCLAHVEGCFLFVGAWSRAWSLLSKRLWEGRIVGGKVRGTEGC